MSLQGSTPPLAADTLLDTTYRLPPPLRDPKALLARALAEWGGRDDLWLFGYGSLIWRPDFEHAERRPARVHGWHRALKMWSRVNRGTPERPGLVLGLLSGGCCQGMAFRIPQKQAERVLTELWDREMPTGVYDPRWLAAHTLQGPVTALAFTLSRKSPNHTGVLSADEYRAIFEAACGRYGTTLEYARRTYEELRRMRIRDRHLERLLRHAPRVDQEGPGGADSGNAEGAEDSQRTRRRR